MFEKVLVPVDFSDHSQKTLECLGDLPGVREVVLLNVIMRNPAVEIWDPVELLRKAEGRLQEEGRRISDLGIEVKPRAVISFDGDASGSIRAAEKKEDVDLVFMGARGMGTIQSAILGSSSRDVLRFGEKNLLIMRYKLLDSLMGPTLDKFCARPFSKVLLPTDFSGPAGNAASFVKGIPGIGEVVLLHVLSEKADGEAKTASEAEERLGTMVQDLAEGGIKATARVGGGDPAEAIRSIAAQEDVSLIAMSSLGKNAPRSGRIGSTTYGVAKGASRPVMVVRMGTTQAV